MSLGTHEGTTEQIEHTEQRQLGALVLAIAGVQGCVRNDPPICLFVKLWLAGTSAVDKSSCA